ncbi:MBL fold metallo-hydrolase [Sesbania bispinosa]|nr:MBL fold metallo-hydrolase [Sesbania bispinosa]
MGNNKSALNTLKVFHPEFTLPPHQSPNCTATIEVQFESFQTTQPPHQSRVRSRCHNPESCIGHLIHHIFFCYLRILPFRDESFNREYEGSVVDESCSVFENLSPSLEEPYLVVILPGHCQRVKMSRISRFHSIFWVVHKARNVRLKDFGCSAGEEDLVMEAPPLELDVKKILSFYKR